MPPGDVHLDPADRMLIATARLLGAALVTSPVDRTTGSPACRCSSRPAFGTPGGAVLPDTLRPHSLFQRPPPVRF